MKPVEPEIAPLNSDVPYYVSALAMGLPAMCFGLTIQPWIDLVHMVRGGYIDFRHLYAAGYMLRSGHASQLYNYAVQKVFQDTLVSIFSLPLPFNHLAYESLIFVPFTFLPYRVAFAAYFAFNVGLLVICFRLMRSHLAQLYPVWRWLPIALFVGFVPLSVTLMQGQDSIILLTLLVGAFVAFTNKREYEAGALVGLGMFKFQLVIPIAALFLAWRQWRFTLGFTLSSAFTVALSIFLVGLQGFRPYVEMLRSMSSQLTPEGQALYAVPPNFMANMRGLIYALAGSRLGPGSLHLMVVSLSALIFLGVAFSAAKASADTFLVAVVASSVLSYHMLAHDMSILLLPIAVTLNQFIQAEGSHDLLARLKLRTATLAFVASSLVAIHRPVFFAASLPVIAFLAALCSRRNLASSVSGGAA